VQASSVEDVSAQPLTDLRVSAARPGRTAAPIAISSDKIHFNIRRLPSEVHGGSTHRQWLGVWAYPTGESEAEWLEALIERCQPDRIVEDWYCPPRHHYEVGVNGGSIFVVAGVTFDADDVTNSDSYVEEEGHQVVGLVQGLILDWHSPADGWSERSGPCQISVERWKAPDPSLVLLAAAERWSSRAARWPPSWRS
jgi:hypothetical protein